MICSTHTSPTQLRTTKSPVQERLTLVRTGQREIELEIEWTTEPVGGALPLERHIAHPTGVWIGDKGSAVKRVQITVSQCLIPHCVHFT